jgi:hypothetical protein
MKARDNGLLCQASKPERGQQYRGRKTESVTASFLSNDTDQYLTLYLVTPK